VQLSDEVIVISPRPGTIVRRIKIDLARPRDLKLRLGPEFQAIVAEIKELFMSYGVI
jgi:NitT/TauT family transport system ATP-binding protein